MSLIGGRLMANDTDLPTANDSEVSAVLCNGETDRRHDSLVAVGMSSDAPDAATLRSRDEKLDFVANGCVKMLDGSLECPSAVEPAVCRGASTARDDEEVLKLVENAAFVDSQRTSANGLVTPHAVGLTDNSAQSVEICEKHPSAATSQTLSSVSRETLLAGGAEKLDLGDAEKRSNASEFLDSACSLEPAELASDLLSLSIADKDNCSTTVPCDDSVAIQSDTKCSEIRYIVYESERQMEAIMQLITKDLSEPYSIYTYRYFIHNWPKLCFLVCIREIMYI